MYLPLMYLELNIIWNLVAQGCPHGIYHKIGSNLTTEEGSHKPGSPSRDFKLQNKDYIEIAKTW